MKNTGFWLRRFLWVAAIVFVMLAAVSLLRGREVEPALSESALWSLISSAIFTGWRYYQARKGAACALCKGPP